MQNDPYAIYVNCDGAMNYDRHNSGGIGFVINFPENSNSPPLSFSIGKIIKGNIENLELEALIQAIIQVNSLYSQYTSEFNSCTRCIFITDRHGLDDNNRTSPFKINTWRKNKWKTLEGEPIKNHKQLDTLDKERKKLSSKIKKSVSIEWRRRKYNKKADKLAKEGKNNPIAVKSIKTGYIKIGKRKFSGDDISYKKLHIRQTLHINIYKKTPVQEKYEILSEVCDGINMGLKLKIFANDSTSNKLKRGNKYIITVKHIFKNHIHIYSTFRKVIKDKQKEEN